MSVANERYHMKTKMTKDLTIRVPASSRLPSAVIFGLQHVHDLGVRAGSSSSDASMTVHVPGHGVFRISLQLCVVHASQVSFRGFRQLPCMQHSLCTQEAEAPSHSTPCPAQVQNPPLVPDVHAKLVSAQHPRLAR